MKPSIPVPCHEDWNQMKIGQYSRHCGSCQKNVMDFTLKSRQEILAYLIENRDREVCGRILPSQLDFRQEEMLVVIRALEKKHHNTNLSYYLLTMATLTLASCQTDIEKPVRTTEHPKVVATPQQSVAAETTTPIQPVTEKAVPIIPPEAIVEPETYIYMESSDTAIFQEFPEIRIESRREKVTTGIVAYNVTNPVCVAEVMPEFKGGTLALDAFVRENLKYPRRERKAGIEGTVYASFIIDEKGKVSHPQILRSFDGAGNLEKAVIKLIRKMPRWIPASNGGQAVPLQFNMPFEFRL